MKGNTKKDLRLQLRLNQEEMSLIDECVELSGKNRTEVVMDGIRMVKRELDKKE